MKVIVPLYSMRSHVTGRYDILKDGNFQLHLHRASPGDVICVPMNSVVHRSLSQFNITFVHIKYGENAYDTRSNFDMSQIDHVVKKYNADLLVTDITGYRGGTPFIFNSNITMDPEVKRDYIDEFIHSDVETVNRSIKTTVLNESQKTTLVANGADPDKIFVDRRVIKPSVLRAFLGNSDPIKVHGIFHPFRISDKCYDFDKVLRDSGNKTVFITDPNDAYSKWPEKHPRVIVDKLTKEEYYAVLLSKPTIMYNENPQKVFHPGLAEFIYFGAEIISEYIMPTLEEVVINEDVWQI
ncbi:hypothetical protein KNT64_gp072 [Pseudomonas phage PspYZU05]|uniref:Uncharacterized protein n=1 Tax=Pseudomonas phage PspYZU05 TaxID=1983556 RepID=A0A2U7NJH1_9CAUD|nr:hypothetical protein KNT64_gp072 [Pseudomonas phage PspYZU05]ASD52024.1 hypothetical protein PspYZU05_72 [Pseudomonas phage PspYZU05]